MATTVLRRASSALAWYVVPAFAVVTVVAYVAGAVVWHANPPAVPVAGVSMKPTLQAGDLVFLKGVDPKSLHVGNIIAVHVPKDSQSQYGLPGEIVHRIVKIQQSPTGPIFHTKGDANSGPDVFTIHSGDIIGRVVGHAAGLGYPLLFFRSFQGKIFLGAAGLVAIIYFLLGLYEDRRIVAEGTAISLQGLFVETQQLKAALAASRYPVIEGTSRQDAVQTNVRRIRERTDQTNETVRELVSAIGEYGTHLRSHTAVMQNLAATTVELERATARLGSVVAEPISRLPLEPALEAPTPTPAPPARPELPRPTGFPPGLPLELARQRVELQARADRVDRLLERYSSPRDLPG